MKDALYVRRIIAPLESGLATALLPADAEADRALSKIALGDIIAIRIDRERSNPQNRLWHALLDHVAEAAPGWNSGEQLGQSVKIELGYFDAVPSLRYPGKAVAVPKSTAFKEMSHEEFCSYFDKGVALICEKVLGGYNPDDLIAEVCFRRNIPRPQHPGPSPARQAADSLGQGDNPCIPAPAATDEEPPPVAQPDASGSGEPMAAAPHPDLIVEPVCQTRHKDRIDYGATANLMINRIRGWASPAERGPWLAANKRLLDEMHIRAPEHRARVEAALGEAE